eukprot:CAMPEP_0201591946 /NCGR_PEP_ID=MMETSP0190_2-20130828/189972_1 /ASSEMBLY_ACC=CAM_ASM_000263 /TAXON_ID=37353 /ORGANISM="Rosalina sp." /LENGTH=333 /DNA_ID=CAMNT_0048050491 /DNA_START=1978 /DNA_END=2979 /DNA_ORIENTATION=-
MKAEVVPQEKSRKSSRNRPEPRQKQQDYPSIMVILEAPICARIGDEVGICRQNKKKEWAFVGGGVIRKTKNIQIASDKERLKENEATKPNDMTFLKSLDAQAMIELFIGNQSFKDDTINPFAAKINAYLKENEITGDKLLEIGRKQFAENLISYAGEKKIRGAATKTFDRFIRLSNDKPSDEQKEEKKNDDQDQNVKNGKIKNGKGKSSKSKPKSKAHLNGKSNQNSPTKMTVGLQRRDDANLNENKQAVHIAYQQRNGRKGMTTIVGLPQEINFKKLVKKMKKQLHSNATLKQDEESGTVIQIQGDKRKDIAAYILKLNIGVEKDQITIRGY